MPKKCIYIQRIGAMTESLHIKFLGRHSLHAWISEISKKSPDWKVLDR